MFETSKLRKLKYWDKIFKQLKDREIQIRRGIAEPFYTSIILYMEDIVEFEKKEWWRHDRFQKTLGTIG